MQSTCASSKAMETQKLERFREALAGRLPYPDADGAPRMTVRHRPLACSRRLDVASTAAVFVEWMRVEGYEGWHTDGDMLEFYGMFCGETGVAPLDLITVLGAIKTQPGIEWHRKRINAAVEPKLRLIRKYFADGMDKVSLYRISSAEEMAARSWRAGGRERSNSKPLISKDVRPPQVAAEPRVRLRRAA